ncbi:hypothetical protein BD324DRAFT_633968 [Kockovaella imperatae]|uniref:Uncharacterized protein n=1 Tax=Kockovaella imperatae TaxID=4999 RepID=A0A1Y1UDH5_9TREE|nr:hypothetical protein BD324DRAFT_633968 [Kockovaella imperatae]ORX35125.1 hypothetical protein BD324DRAFT_633968 [Kockovaella imperatae]
MDQMYPLIRRFGVDGSKEGGVKNAGLLPDEDQPSRVRGTDDSDLFDAFSKPVSYEEAWRDELKSMTREDYYTSDTPKFAQLVRSRTYDEAQARGEHYAWLKQYEEARKGKKTFLLTQEERDALDELPSLDIALARQKTKAEVARDEVISKYTTSRTKADFANSNHFHPMSMENAAQKKAYGLDESQGVMSLPGGQGTRYATDGRMIDSIVDTKYLDTVGSTAAKYLSLAHAEEMGTDDDLDRWVLDRYNLNGRKILLDNSELANNDAIKRDLESRGISDNRGPPGCTDPECQSKGKIWCQGSTHHKISPFVRSLALRTQGRSTEKMLMGAEDPWKWHDAQEAQKRAEEAVSEVSMDDGLQTEDTGTVPIHLGLDTAATPQASVPISNWTDELASMVSDGQQPSYVTVTTGGGGGGGGRGGGLRA